MKQVGFKPEVKERGVMDEQSGESEEEEVMGEGIYESEIEEASSHKSAQDPHQQNFCDS